MNRTLSQYNFVSSIPCLVLAVVLSALLSSGKACAEEQQWWPLQVKSYYGTYDAYQKEPGHAARSLDRPKLEEWVPPRITGNTYRLGISIPHLKDSYWVAVSYGLITEARRLGVGLTLVEAGGYGELDTQIEQIQTLVKSGVDGLILGAIGYQGNDAIIAEVVKQGIPVVAFVNDVKSQDVSAKALVSFQEMGYLAGEFVAEDAEKDGLHTVRIAFFPGPEKTGWAPETLDGFKASMAYFPGTMDIVDIRWDDTGLEKQRALLRASLMENSEIDYIVGNALAAEAATELLAEMGLTDKIKVVSTYIIPSLYDKIREGLVVAAPSDLTVFQGRMAVDMMVRTLDGEKPGRDFPFRSGPFIPIVTPENAERYPYEGLFGPRDFVPVFNLEPGQ